MQSIGKNLQDPIRQFFYEKIWQTIQLNYPNTAHRRLDILDIGTRDSRWAAFLSQQGYNVTAIDRWEQFAVTQQAIIDSWGTSFNYIQADLLDTHIKLGSPFDIVTDIFAIQHNGNTGNDLRAWTVCAQKVKAFGALCAVVKLGRISQIHTDRDDGALRDYTLDEIQFRLVRTVNNTWGRIAYSGFEYFQFHFPTQTVIPVYPNVDDANCVLVTLIKG